VLSAILENLQIRGSRAQDTWVITKEAQAFITPNTQLTAHYASLVTVIGIKRTPHAAGVRRTAYRASTTLRGYSVPLVFGSYAVLFH